MDEARRHDERSQRSVVAQRLLAFMKAIADTGFIVAFRNRTDQHHAWAVDLARQLDGPAFTCEAVLSEAALTLVTSGMLRVAFDCAQNIEHLHDLAVRYADRKPDLADLCLIRMSELLPRHAVITIDDDFRVYRRNKREAIPLLCPPKTKK